MHTTRYDAKAVPSPGLLVNTGTFEGSHAVYDHLHLDIQETDGDVLAKVQKFIDRSNESAGKRVLTWEPFRRVTFEDIMDVWERRGYSPHERVAHIVSDYNLFGAPVAHVTAKFTGLRFGEEYDKFSSLYRNAVDMVQQIDSAGYIEWEEIGFRVETKGGVLDLKRQPSPCPVREINKVSLASLGRKFRTTEIHISFERIDLVHPELLADIFSQGFYTAFREKDGNYSIIATIQGFEREILIIAADMYRWLMFEVESGGIGCPVVIKKEDITGWCVFGSEPKLQMVVRPEFW